MVNSMSVSAIFSPSMPSTLSIQVFCRAATVASEPSYSLVSLVVMVPLAAMVISPMAAK